MRDSESNSTFGVIQPDLVCSALSGICEGLDGCKILPCGVGIILLIREAGLWLEALGQFSGGKSFPLWEMISGGKSLLTMGNHATAGNRLS